MAVATPPPSQTILVVEDMPFLRMMAVDMIEDAGFDTIEAADVESAIAILEQRPDVRVVFTDVDMPNGMNGMTFAALIRDRWPPIEIIITSGKQWVATQTMPDRAVFLPKPYHPDQVLGQIRQMLAASGAH